MATNYNIRLKRFNGTDYDNLYPNTLVEQVTGNWPTNRLSGTIAKTQIAQDNVIIEEILLQRLF